MGDHGRMEIQSLSAVTLVVADMARAVAFYDTLGLQTVHGGADEPFTSYRVGASFLNLQQGDPGDTTRWGRAILHVDDVDAVWQRLDDAGWTPDAAPADADWGERYFHVRDPDGHELSFARPLPARDRPVLQVGVRAEDLHELHRLNQAEVPAVGPLDLGAFSELLDLAERTVVARLAGDVVAFMVLFLEGSTYGSPNYRWFAERLERFAYVDRVVVAPGGRRRGLGRLLYDHAVAVAADRPLTAEVNTGPRNEVSLAFHDDMGFVEVGRQVSPGGDKEVAMLSRPPQDQLTT